MFFYSSTRYLQSEETCKSTREKESLIDLLSGIIRNLSCFSHEREQRRRRPGAVGSRSRRPAGVLQRDQRRAARPPVRCGSSGGGLGEVTGRGHRPRSLGLLTGQSGHGGGGFHDGSHWQIEADYYTSLFVCVPPADESVLVQRRDGDPVSRGARTRGRRGRQVKPRATTRTQTHSHACRHLNPHCPAGSRA